MTALERFDLADDDGFRARVASAPRLVVLMRGDGCPYSARFEKHFLDVPAPPGWGRAIRAVEEGGRGPVAEALGVVATPTVVAFERGRERARLEATLLLGLSRNAYEEWLAELEA